MSITTYHHDDLISIDTENGEIELPAQFKVTVERWPAEPYSHGGSRGYEFTVEAEIEFAMFGGLKLSLADLKAVLKGQPRELDRQIEVVRLALVEGKETEFGRAA